MHKSIATHTLQLSYVGHIMRRNCRMEKKIMLVMMPEEQMSSNMTDEQMGFPARNVQNYQAELGRTESRRMVRRVTVSTSYRALATLPWAQPQVSDHRQEW